MSFAPAAAALAQAGEVVAASAPLLILLARRAQAPVGDHILASRVRRALMETVVGKPGVTLGELRKRLGIGWGTAYHHVRKLERAGEVRLLRVGRRLIVHPMIGADERVLRAIAILRGQSAMVVCEEVARSPGTNVARIVERTGLSPRVVYYHVEQLRAHGLIESRSTSRVFELHVAPLVDEVRVYQSLRE